MPDSTRTFLDLNLSQRLVAGDAVAIRATAILEPAGGPGDKVFPPSHSVDDKTRELYGGVLEIPRLSDCGPIEARRAD